MPHASGITATEWIWKDGSLIRWDDARVHILSLAVQFGSSVFEGIRCYDTPRGPAIFRLSDHLRRLHDSCRIYRIALEHDIDTLTEACAEVVRRNALRACYLRPIVLRGYGAVGMLPAGSTVETFIPAWPWGAYLGEEALEAGVDVCVSSWQRAEPNTFPSLAKAAGNYNNAQLIKMEAVANGYAEAIATGPGGLVSEGSGQNLFLVRDGELLTPTVDGTILSGITRDSIMTLAREMGIPVHAQPIPREMLYCADELFFSGTASEVTPIRSVDRIAIGSGRAGPITKKLQARFLQIARGEEDDEYGWRTEVA
ncbi:MAG TPA: branched-chain amino acid transaminase [Gemmatimonadaceae bacterium]|nr:branched-chain amino acid transaminase [Gemmatimonadaceae bacterium]